MRKTPETPHDLAYDRAYFAAYGIDPDEVAPLPRPEVEARLWSADGYPLDVWMLSETCAVAIEDPNGAHPCAYEYEHESEPWWSLRQVYPLTADGVWRLVGGREPAPQDERVDVCIRTWDDAKKDLSAYYTEDPLPPCTGEYNSDYGPYLGPIEDKAESTLAVKPLDLGPEPERERPKPKRKQRVTFLGIKFEF